MSNCGLLLRSGGFNESFLPFLDKAPDFKEGVNTLAYVVIIDEPNLARYVLEDFTCDCKDPSSMVYTHLDLQAIKKSEADKETFDAKTNVIGPGLHKHSNGLYLCHQMAGMEQKGLLQTKLQKTDAKLAIISLKSLLHAREYLNGLHKTNKEEEKLKVYVSQDMQWMQYKYELTCPKTLFLGDNWDKIHSEVKDFFSQESETWYRDHCIPYTRSLLFYGPPGNGKSKTIRALGSVFNMPVYVLNLAHARLDDDYLVQLVKDVGERSFLVVEDIDRIFDNHSVNTSESHISFATLLNLLDGTLTKEGIFVIMTCNEINLLDDALKRCGRVAGLIEFKDVNAARAKDMFLSFYPKEDDLATEFGQAVRKESKVSGATLQEHFIRKRKQPASEACVLDSSFLSKRRAKDKHANLM